MSEATFNRKKQMHSHVAEFLNPSRGYRDDIERLGIRPVDYITANRQKLREKSKQFKDKIAARETAEKQKEVLFKMPRFKKVESRVAKQMNKENVNSHTVAQKTSSIDSKSQYKKHSFLRRKPKSSPEQTPLKSRTNNNSIIASTAKTRATTRVSTKAPVPKRTELNHVARPHRGKDFVTSNAVEAIYHMSPSKKQNELVSPSDSETHSSFGNVPEYLIERKAKWAEEEATLQANAQDPSCPIGTKRMNEDERLQLLSELTRDFKTTQDQLTRMPLTIATTSQKAKKAKLDTKLQELDEAIKIFSRKYVFIDKDA